MWDTTELHLRFERAENREVIAYLERHHPSAHGDLGEELFKAAAVVPNHQWYAPNIHQYSYVLLHTSSGVIYALAVGMVGLVFRLPTSEVAAALAAGGKAGRVELKYGEASRLPFAENTFDKAFAIHNIYFWPKPIDGLKQLRRVLKPGGVLIITVLPKAKWPTSSGSASKRVAARKTMVGSANCEWMKEPRFSSNRGSAICLLLSAN